MAIITSAVVVDVVLMRGKNKIKSHSIFCYVLHPHSSILEMFDMVMAYTTFQIVIEWW